MSRATKKGPAERAPSASGPVSPLVNQLRLELHILTINNQEIYRRIRRVIQRLQEVAQESAFDCFNPALDSSPSDDERQLPRQSSASTSTSTSTSNPTPTSVSTSVSHPPARFSGRRTGSRRFSLIRACRIALLEASPASLDEIQERIARRGSFPFAGPASGRALRRVLRVMTQLGEVRALNGPGCCRWERVPPPEGYPVLDQTPQVLSEQSGKTISQADE